MQLQIKASRQLPQIFVILHNFSTSPVKRRAKNYVKCPILRVCKTLSFAFEHINMTLDLAPWRLVQFTSLNQNLLDTVYEEILHPSNRLNKLCNIRLFEIIFTLSICHCHFITLNVGFVALGKTFKSVSLSFYLFFTQNSHCHIFIIFPSWYYHF